MEDLSGCFDAGLTAVAGPNGAGKTTLLRAIAGLHSIASGRIEGIGGPQGVALLPQSGGLDRRFPITCRDLVSFGAWGRTGAFGTLHAADAIRVQAALDRMGIAGLADRLVGALSAGQFQRVLFARLIVQDAPVILLDEPFTAVDAATEQDLLELLHIWAEEGRTVIAVLHDNEMILRHFPKTLLLSRSAVAWGESHAVLSVEHRRTARLLSEGRSNLALQAA